MNLFSLGAMFRLSVFSSAMIEKSQIMNMYERCKYLKNYIAAPNLELQLIISHNGKQPDIHPSAYIAPTATICGDVTIGQNCRVMHGAAVVAEGGKIRIGEHCIIIERVLLN